MRKKTSIFFFLYLGLLFSFLPKTFADHNFGQAAEKAKNSQAQNLPGVNGHYSSNNALGYDPVLSGKTSNENLYLLTADYRLFTDEYYAQAKPDAPQLNPQEWFSDMMDLGEELIHGNISLGDALQDSLWNTTMKPVLNRAGYVLLQSLLQSFRARMNLFQQLPSVAQKYLPQTCTAKDGSCNTWPNKDPSLQVGVPKDFFQNQPASP